ncbi:MAG: conserved phage C-terminal domain-containing protein, partial [Candidatus Kerfeldbacteria bacterium]|nr:conserved phage C-terminal domain-containing protein [Candidatus Kerfeldbacteria bacterium]
SQCVRSDGEREAGRKATWGSAKEVVRSLTRAEQKNRRRRNDEEINPRDGGGILLQAREVLDYLNMRTGSRFRLVGPTQRFLLARLKSGITVDDLKRIIDMKVSEWLGDQVMEKYLRPATLFNATKCESYLGQVDRPNRQQVDQKTRSTLQAIVRVAEKFDEEAGRS